MPRIALGSQDPQPCIILIYYSPGNLLGFFVKRLNTVSADFHSLSVNHRPLEIGFLAVSTCRIIMTAKEFSLGHFHRFFTAARTTHDSIR